MKNFVMWGTRFLLCACLALVSNSCTHQEGLSEKTLRSAVSFPNQKLEKLSKSWWDLWLRRWPNVATYLGDHRYDDQLPDLSASGKKDFLFKVREMVQAAEKIPASQMSEEDQLTHETLLWSLNRTLDTEICHEFWWGLDQLYGPQVWLVELPAYHQFKTDEDVHKLVRRYERVTNLLAQHQVNLGRGMRKGWLVPVVIVDRVIGQLDRLLTIQPEDSSFMAVTKRWPQDWPVSKTQDLQLKLLEAVQKSVYPAFSQMRRFLKDVYRPSARNTVGVDRMPDGERCYATLIKYETGSDLSPRKIHEIGLTELSRLQGEMLAIAKRLSGHSVELKSFLGKLKASPDQYVSTPEQLVSRAQDVLSRAQASLHKVFSHLPKTPIEVRPMLALRAEDAPAAYYFQAPDDGSRPAIFYLNTNDLEARPLYNLEALTFHEAVPGHHLQIAFASEQKGLPAFRGYFRQNAFIEGWALYAEQLAVELGLYSGDFSRVGQLGYQAWRAVRLVVDTGIHALGWSRERAIEFMESQTALSRQEAVNEVDRYIIWPGQALSYMLGRMTFQRLRAQAEERLGPRFDLKAFHHEVLRHGAVPLSTLSNLVDRWIERRLADQ
ncbi:MAG: DUF885 domain-containing protein [Pseudomonadota bacterium]